MTSRRIDLGKEGEGLALEALNKSGYRIIERNFKNKLGEIDLIARENNVICFIEVKTRADESFGGPLEAVSKTKQRKLSQVALSYLKSKGLIEQEARFDVVAVMIRQDGTKEAQILKNAFELSPPYSY